MIKRVVLHDLDYNWLAPCKEWYYKAHAPQIVRRHGPWLARFESFRPAPFPAGARGEEHGYTNWLCTVGCWRACPGVGGPGTRLRRRDWAAPGTHAAPGAALSALDRPSGANYTGTI